MQLIAMGHPHLAALINLGGNPLVVLIVLLLVCGFVWLLWSKVAMPLLANVIGEPFLGIVNWLVIAILVLIVLSKALEILFGISLFGSFNS